MSPKGYIALSDNQYDNYNYVIPKFNDNIKIIICNLLQTKPIKGIF